MANKKVSQLVSKPSVLVTDLFPIADPTTGQLYKTTISDLGTAIGSGVSSVNTLVGAVVLDTDDIQELASPTNRWFTDTRARAALSASSPLAYNSGTGVFSIPQATGSQNGFLSSADWTTFNAKQQALSGTGFVKISGTTISYDNSTYLTTSAAASTYLALSGGTLTGALNGTSANFSGDLTLTGTNPRFYLTDSDNNPDYFISNTDGTFTVYDVTNSTSRFTIGTTGNGTFGGNLTVGQIIRSGGTSAQFLKADGSIDSSTYALDSDVVKLTGNQTINGVKTFDAAVIINNSLNIVSGFYSIINNPGNTAYWQTYVDSSNLFIFGYQGTTPKVTINSSGNLTANSFIKSSGTSSQFLKADGSVDSTAYLSLAGGTLTGALSGTSVSLSSSITASSLYVAGMTAGSGAIYYNATVGRLTLANYNANGILDFEVNGGASALTLNANLSATFKAGASFAGAISATTGTFSGNTFIGGSTLYNPTFAQRFLVLDAGTSGDNSSMLQLMGSRTVDGTYGAIEFMHQAQANRVAIRAKRSGANNSVGLDFLVTNAGTTATALDILHSGAATFSSSVGIGVTPSVRNLGAGLDLEGGASVSGFSNQSYYVNNAYYNNVWIYKASSTASMYFQSNDGSHNWYSAPSGTAGASFSWTPSMIITASGNVGIGTTAPSYLLSLATTLTGTASGDNTALFLESQASGRDLNIRFGDTVNASGRIGYISGDLYMFTNGSERMRITSGGAVCVNSSSATYGEIFKVANSGASANTALFYFTNTNDRANIISRHDGSLSTNSREHIVFINGNGVGVGSITANGSATSYNITSDYRLKEDLKPINGLDIVNKIKVYDYKWKSANIRMDGVMAHELAEVLPYAVTGIKDGEQMQQVDYSKIVPVMVQAIKELKAELDTLKNK